MQDFKNGVRFCVETWGELGMLLVPFKNAWEKVIEYIHSVSISLERQAWKERNDKMDVDGVSASCTCQSCAVPSWWSCVL